MTVTETGLYVLGFLWGAVAMWVATRGERMRLRQKVANYEAILGVVSEDRL